MKNAQTHSAYHRGYEAGTKQSRIVVPPVFTDLLDTAADIGDFELNEKVEACKKWLAENAG